MAAPSSTVPAATATKNQVSLFTYLREVVSETASLLQEVPVAVTSEAAYVLQDVPIVSIVFKTFLSLEQLVETASSNKDDLANLSELIEVVIEGLLDKRSDRSGLFKGFTALEKHVHKAKEVANLCNGRVRRVILSRKICKDIISVRNDILGFCTATNLVITHDTHVSKGVSFVLAMLGREPERCICSMGQTRVSPRSSLDYGGGAFYGE